jgi:hypothetical protein
MGSSTKCFEVRYYIRRRFQLVTAGSQWRLNNILSYKFKIVKIKTVMFESTVDGAIVMER